MKGCPSIESMNPPNLKKVKSHTIHTTFLIVHPLRGTEKWRLQESGKILESVPIGQVCMCFGSKH